MKNKAKWALFAIVLVGAVPLLARGLDSWHYATSDSLTQNQIDTERVLTRFERSNDAAELRRWIVNGPTEAGATQRDLTFGNWALQHPKRFAGVVESLDEGQQSRLAESFCGSLNQSALAPKFRAQFRGNQSQGVARLAECMVLR